MAVNCGVIFGVCRVRITKVDAAGNVVAGATNSYVTDKVEEVQLNPNIDTGDNVVVRNGCGCKVASKKFPDTFNFWELQFTDAAYEPAMEQLMIGGETIVDGSDVVGNAFPTTLACDEDPAFVAFEWWSENQVGSGPDGALPWIHFVIPKVKWVVGNDTFGINESPALYTGSSETNSQWGQGPYGDGPPDGQDISEGGRWKTDIDPPDAECAGQSVTDVS